MKEAGIAPSVADKNEARDLDIAALVGILWRGKWWVGLFAALGAAAGLSYAFTTPEFFRAEALLQIRQQNGSSANLNGLAAVAAQLGGLAGVGGLSLGGGADREVAVATLRSRTVIETFIKDRNLLPKLYKDKWDSKADAWRDSDPNKNPTVWQAYNDFTKKVLEVSEDRRTGLVTVAVEWTNPVEAQQWVTELIARTNAQLRDRAIQEGEKNLAYLYAQAEKIGQVALAQALYGLVEGQLKQLMVAKGADEFALKTIDPAAVPKRKIRPHRVSILAVGVLGGGLLGMIVAVWRNSRARRARIRGKGLVAPSSR